VVVDADRVKEELPRWTERINLRRPHWKGQPLHFTDLDERTKLFAGWSVTALPWDLWTGNLSKEQADVYRTFGYEREKLVRPGLILPVDC
jgi:hypothetical protein